MTRPKKNTGGDIRQVLRAIALRYPEVVEGIACKGTALECSAFKAKNKTFLFMSGAEIKLKLQASLPEAGRLAGSAGWVTVKFDSEEFPSQEVLEKWVDESYRLLAPAKLAAQLPERDASSGKAVKTATKKVPKKAR